MKSIVSAGFLLLFLTAPLARAQVALPTLTIQGQGKTEKLELREMSLSVELEGGLAETVLELEFFNHTTRNQEGEFVLKLPKGATVSTYALEVNGKMRPGVSVEKEQARNAYESIKRRMVDPGLVEREAGNTYRTRIFPIIAKQTKRVRIGYFQQLDGEDFDFVLKEAISLKSFSCAVRGGKSAELKMPGTKATEESKEGDWHWEGTDIKLNGELKAQTKLPKGEEIIQRVDQAPDGTTHFVVQGRLPENWKPKERPKPDKVRVLWDASLSGRLRDHETEFTALDRYLKWAGDTEVTIQLLRNQLGKPRKFLFRKGDSSGLIQVLKEVGYDGAADFSKIDEFEGTTLFFTDGELSSPIWSMKANPAGKGFPLFVISHTSLNGESGLLGTGAVGLNLNDKDWWDALTMDREAISVAGLPEESWDLTHNGDRYLISGRIPAKFQGAVVFRPDGGQVFRIQAKDFEKVDSDWGFARRVWAQRRLLTLEGEGNREAIETHAVAERLVSDLTSLIVLERFEDHIRYRIPPPEPDLLTRYQSEIKKGSEMARNQAMQAWRRKISWHRAEYPWIDWKLAEEVSTVGVWVKSARAAFPEEKLNKKAIEPYEKWLPNARKAVDSKATLKTQEDFDQWRVEVGRNMQRLQEIREMPAPELKPGQPIHVSVRGFVNRRGVFSSEAPLLLREAIGMAGGLHIPWGSWSRVFLYRDARRTGYNLESDEYEPVALRWGDMVVVENVNRPDYGDYFGAPVDPFAAPAGGGGGAGHSAGNQPAVFEEPGSGSGGAPAPGMLPAGFAPAGASRPATQNMKIELVSREPEKLAIGLDKALLKTLQEAKDPSTAYEKLVTGSFREKAPSPATLIAMARMLFEKGETKLGERVLSNLLELLANKVEATRAFALWLHEFGARDLAEKVLNQLVAAVPDEATKALIRYDLAQFAKESAGFGQVVASEIKSGSPTAMSTMALTDYFGRGGEPENELRIFEANRLRSDVRIVVVSAGETVQMSVKEPGSEQQIRNGVSAHGGRGDASPRVHEYQMRHGLPGTYEVFCRRPGGGNFAGVDMSAAAADDLPPITLRVTYYTRWGTENQAEQTKTLLMDGGELRLDGVNFGWEE